MEEKKMYVEITLDILKHAKKVRELVEEDEEEKKKVRIFKKILDRERGKDNEEIL